MPIGVPLDAKPFIKAKHIDGPVLCMRTGEMHWLTLWERVQFCFGRTDAYKLEEKYRPGLAAHFEQARKRQARAALSATPVLGNEER